MSKTYGTYGDLQVIIYTFVEYLINLLYMKEGKKVYSTFSIDNIDVSTSKPGIRNFFISDESSDGPANASFNHPYMIDGIAFSICIQGYGRIKINLKEYVVEKNVIITIAPNTVIELLERSDDFLMEYLLFSVDFISDMGILAASDLPEKIELEPCLNVSEEQTLSLLELHAIVVKQYNRIDHIFREELAKTLLVALLIEVASVYNLPREREIKVLNRKEELFNNFMQLLIKYNTKERSVTFYADKLCLTPKYMAQIIKGISGKSALEWINNMTILSIKAMLKSSNHTVLQISEDMNFPNPSFFGRYFKEHTGMTPIQYRES